MRWIVGVDLVSRSGGAVRFAAWLRQHAKQAKDLQLDAVHVVRRPEDAYKVPLEPQSAGELARFASPDAAAALRESEPAFDRVQVVVGTDAVRGLIKSGGDSGFDGIIIGRIAGQRSKLPPRLGPVARKILRELPSAVIVVPSDMRETDVGTGPVIIATDLGDHCADAARFGAAFAGSVGRQPILLHVAPGAGEFVPTPASTSGWAHRESYRDSIDRRVAAWQDRNKLDGIERGSAFGDPVQRLLAMAKRLDAAMIVCGSRRLSAAQRLLLPSVATRLAAIAPCPVAVAAAGSFHAVKAPSVRAAFERVLVPIEFSSEEGEGVTIEPEEGEPFDVGSSTVKALDIASRLAGREICLVHAERPDAKPGESVPALRELAKLFCPDAQVELMSAPGTPIDVILKTADEFAADAIVVAAGGSEKRLLQTAKCPVVVVSPPPVAS